MVLVKRCTEKYHKVTNSNVADTKWIVRTRPLSLVTGNSATPTAKAPAK